MTSRWRGRAGNAAGAVNRSQRAHSNCHSTPVAKRVRVPAYGKHAASQALGRDIAEEALHNVHPRRRGRREVHVEPRVLGQPVSCTVLVGGRSCRRSRPAMLIDAVHMPGVRGRIRPPASSRRTGSTASTPPGSCEIPSPALWAGLTVAAARVVHARRRDPRPVRLGPRVRVSASSCRMNEAKLSRKVLLGMELIVGSDLPSPSRLRLDPDTRQRWPISSTGHICCGLLDANTKTIAVAPRRRIPKYC